MIAMKRGLHELSDLERIELRDGLMMPAGEFVAMFAGALLTLGLLVGTATLSGAARQVVLTTAARLSDAMTQIGMIGTRMEAEASEHDASDHNAVAAKPR